MGKVKLEKALQEKLSAEEKIFSPFITAGDGGLDILPERIKFFEENGAAVIELGIPFSDPVADGPTIQAAGSRALDNGTTLAKVLDVLEKTKLERAIPVVIMTYINPIITFGIEDFARKCAEAGVDGVIIPDLPMEEESLIAEALSKGHIAFIRLAAMTSPTERLQELAERTEGFLYAVAVTGTTGARTEHDAYVSTFLQKLKTYTNTPVLAGFGVSTGEQARALGEHSDGVIVGSKIVQLLHEGKLAEISQLMEESRSLKV
ncbi:tryptophan synthase subunit alpha [Oceanobacillus alkalisoli]|uniref:tryptophan synthase subunit alpha n=1 Tax=Oceanobacillus alkalisoli TaxID=2925113 RepID=UPI001EF0F9C0|nr:tryptophan synthase subunit alpha [Oceanobacillus alkalisoli]MCF3944571.1 tryptophan synthase subunit alpha [Oceanobacillus alkalisoli]MCG5102212.1 tryptophan synthase subunit alpha [Oceanobacillus alkalisoli]